MTGTSAAVQATCRRSSYRPHRVAGRKAEYGRFSVLPRPEIHRNLRIKDSVKIDPCMGSGHILVYAFDVLMDIYRSRGYTDRDAVQSIVTNNLFGLDIDDRAAQLAYFAVMMKACEYDRRFLRRGIQPQVCAIQESPAIDAHALDSFGPDAALAKKLYATFIDAKEYGSILHVDLTGDELRRLSHSVIAMGAATTGESIANLGDSKHAAEIIAPLVKQATIMARKYDVVVTNPPYMGASGMGEKLSKFVKDNYPDSKSDMFAVFIEKCTEYMKKTGYQAMITQHAWMFLSSFEKLRHKLQQHEIVNMVHLGARAFEEIGGEVVQTTAFVLQNNHITGYAGSYARLIEPTTQQGKEDMFLAEENRYTAQQENFTKIPGMPVAYWVSDSIRKAYNKGKPLNTLASVFEGLKTRDKERFLRYWFEVNSRKWVRYAKGGAFRRWYGNGEYVVAWDKDGTEIRDFKKSSGANYQYYFMPSVTYSAMTSKSFSGRFIENQIFGGGGGGITNTEYVYFILAFVNSTVFDKFLNLLSATMNFEVGQIGAQPVVIADNSKANIEMLSKQNVHLSQTDWDSFETSWDFQCHPLI